MRPLIALFTVVVLAATGCSTDDDQEGTEGGATRDRAAVLEAIGEGLDSQIRIEDEAAACLGEAIADTVDDEQFEVSEEDFEHVASRSSALDFGFLDLSESQAESLVDAAEGCGVPLTDMVEAESGASIPDPGDEAAVGCWEDAATEETVRPVVAEAMAKGWPDNPLEESEHELWAQRRACAEGAGDGTGPSIAEGASDATPGEIDGFGVVVGDPDAPHTVTVYEDLQCPACAEFEHQVGADLAAAIDAGEIRVDYRIVSFLDQVSTDDYSSRAMNALLVALEHGGVDSFRAMHQELFANQPSEGGRGSGTSDDDFIAQAAAAGATGEGVEQGIVDKVHDQWIRDATAQMSVDGVTSTPTVLIDGDEKTVVELQEFLGR